MSVSLDRLSVAAHSADDIGELAVSWAVSKLGVKETAPNSGPEIDDWLRRVGLPPGNQWCAAFVYSAFAEASRQLAVVNPCPRTASSQRMWTLSDAVCHVITPRRGDLYVVSHGGGKGHVGLVEDVFGPESLALVSGNTNAQGSRVGDCVGRHVGDPETVHHADLVGFVRLSLAPTRALLA